MNISDFLDEHLGRSTTDGSRSSIRRFWPTILSPEYPKATDRSALEILPLMSTLYWQAFLCSNTVRRHIERAGAPSWITTDSDVFVARHGAEGSSYDLLILSPALEESDVFTATIELSDGDLETGWLEFSSRHKDNANSNWEEIIYNSVLVPEMLKEFRRKRSPALIIAALPEAITTASVPGFAVSIEGDSNDLQERRISTAGVVATDKDQRTGFTAAFHAIAKGSMYVTVNGVLSKIVSTDVITDSCFIEANIDGISTKMIKGPLAGHTPRQYEVATFVGVASGEQKTMVVAWSPDLPFTIPGSQLKILTDLSTAAGDSGAALVDDEGYVLGFAFYRTGYGSKPSFSAWIWAESVFIAHELNY